MCVSTKGIFAGDGVVVKPREVTDRETGVLPPRYELFGLDKPAVMMGASFNQAEKIFRSEDRENKRLQVPVQGGEENVSAGFHQPSACPDYAFRMRYML